MANLAAVKAEVLRIVEDHITPLTDAITTHVQRAQKSIEDRCAFPVQESTTFFLTAAGVNYFQFASDFITDRDEFYTTLKVDSEYVTFLQEISEETERPISAVGSPKYWTRALKNDLPGFRILPDDDGLGPFAGPSYGIFVPYFRRLSTLTVDADTNWWTDNLDDVLAWKAAANVYAEMRDPMAQFWNGVAMARFKEILSATRRNKLRKTGNRIYPSQSLSGNQRKRYKRIIVAQVP